jgi:beta-glucosidase
MDSKTLTFPKGFLWGTATAAHQVEGNNIHSDWWDFEQKGKTLSKESKCTSILYRMVTH